MASGGAHHQHFMNALEPHDAGLDAQDRVGAYRLGVLDDALEGQVAGGVEDIAVFPDFAATQALETAEQSSAEADRVSHVPEHEFQRLVTRVHQAIQLLPVATGGEPDLLGIVMSAVQGRSDGQELDIAFEMGQLVGDAGDADAAPLLGLAQHPLKRGMASLADDVGHLGDLAAEGALELGADAPDDPEGVDAVADDQFARPKAFELETIHFVAGQAGDDRALAGRDVRRGNQWRCVHSHALLLQPGES